MRRFLSILFILAALGTLASCRKASLGEYYELVDGDPTIDFVYFFSDDSVQFVAPGPFNMLQDYSREGDSIVRIHIIDNIYASLYRLAPDTLVGQAPFFEGVWVRRDRPTR